MSFMVGCSNPPEAKSRIDIHPSFQSEFVDARDVEVFLPRQYFEEETTQFDVLYMHDGQNVFNASTAYGGVAWEADSILQDLMDKGTIRPAIIVAIWNNGMMRYNEYCPENPFMQLDSAIRDSIDDEYGLKGNMMADEYLKFMVSEVKPFIDKTYRTQPEAEHTFIMGSSMGGLISSYALLEYPEVFGGAACLSTHWPFSHASGPHPFADVMIDYVVQKYDQAKDVHLLYFDLGTTTLDSLYPAYQARLDSLILSRYGARPNYMSRTFEGAAHNEASWKERLEVPLTFLLSVK